MTRRLFNVLLKEFSGPAIVGVLLAFLFLQYQQTQELQQSIAAIKAVNPAMHSDVSASVFSYADAVEKAMPAVVNIFTRKIISRAPVVADPLLQRLLDGNISKQERVEGSLGSGVLVRSEGYVLTNYHVIADADQILVSLHDGRDAEAKLIGLDKETDLAVLKIDLPDMTVINFGDPQHARIGDVVLAIGNPFGIGQTVTQGIISAAARYGLELSIQENYLQTDAAINQGNSGGALVDAAGNLIGINTAIQSPTGGSVGIGYAVPSDTARKVLDDIVQYGHVVRGWIGIESQALPEYSARSLGLTSGQGIVVRNIYRNGPAALAGLLPGDVITYFDDVPATATRSGVKRIAHAQPGEKVEVRFLRGSQVGTATITIGVRPAS
jgi:serine protease DegS